MSGFITAEGLVIPIGTDYYDYVNDQKRLADSVRSVVPVASQTAGNTVGSSMASDGRPVSDTNPLIIWESDSHSIWVKGSSGEWMPCKPPDLHTVDGKTHYGTDSGLSAAISANTTFPIFQAGSVVVTTDVNGYGNFAWPIAFPNGVISCVACNGDDNATGPGVFVTLGSASINKTTCYINAWRATNAAWASNPIRVDYWAVGW